MIRSKLGAIVLRLVRVAAYIMVAITAYPQLQPRELSVDEAISLALERSESVRIKLSDEKRATYAISEAKSKLFPTFDVNASASYMTDPQEGITIRRGSLGYSPAFGSETPVSFPDRDYVIVEDSERTFFNISGTITQPIFTWFKIKNAIDLATIERNVARYNTLATKNELVQEIRTVYFGALVALESTRILEQALSTAAEIVEDQQRSYEEGLINLQVLLQAKSRQVVLESQVVQSLESYASALEALAMLTGIETPQLALTTDFRTQLPELDEDSLKTSAIQRSIDVRIARARLKQAQKYIEIERGGSILLPDISLVVTVDISGQRVPVIGANWIENWDTNIILTLGTKVRLFDSFQSHWKIRQAEEQERMALLGLAQMEQGLNLLVRKTIEKTRLAFSHVQKFKVILTEMQEQYKNARVSFENELITRSEERGARILLLSTELEYLFSLFNFEIALTELEYAVGKHPWNEGL